MTGLFGWDTTGCDVADDGRPGKGQVVVTGASPDERLTRSSMLVETAEEAWERINAFHANKEPSPAEG